MKTKEDLEREIRRDAVAKYTSIMEDFELETGPWERFKHSEELNREFFGDYDLYCDWLNVGRFTEFDDKARCEWVRWADERFPGIQEESNLVMDIYTNPGKCGFEGCRSFKDITEKLYEDGGKTLALLLEDAREEAKIEEERRRAAEREYASSDDIAEDLLAGMDL